MTRERQKRQAENVQDGYEPETVSTKDRREWLAFKVNGPEELYVRFEPNHCGFVLTQKQVGELVITLAGMWAQMRRGQ